jgi:hypothetical protein
LIREDNVVRSGPPLAFTGDTINQFNFLTVRLHLTLSTVGLVLLAWLNGSVALADTPQTDTPDYDIPAGHFFTEGVSQEQQQGLGFAVFDGDRAALWTAFQSDGGQPPLGFPTSRRFELNGNVAQAFSNAVLVWNRAQAQAEVRAVHERPSAQCQQAGSSTPQVTATIQRSNQVMTHRAGGWAPM